MNVVFMGTPHFSVPTLALLLDYEKEKKIHLTGVYTQPDQPHSRGMKNSFSPVKEFALKYHLPLFQPVSLSLEQEKKTLFSLRPDVIVVVAFGQILKKDILDFPKYGCVNLHPSLLPRWRGPAPIPYALLAGDTVTGVTTMKLVKEVDAGDIFLQKTLPIHETDTTFSLQHTLAEQGALLIGETLMSFKTDHVYSRPQDVTQVTFSKKLEKKQEQLDPFSQTAQQLNLQIRAFFPWPGSVIFFQKKRIKILQTSVDLSKKNETRTLLKRKQEFIYRNNLWIFKIRNHSVRRKKTSKRRRFFKWKWS